MLSSLASLPNVVSFSNSSQLTSAYPASELLRYNFAPTTSTTISNIFTGQPIYTATLNGGITTTTAVKPPHGVDNTHSLFCPSNASNSTRFLNITQITVSNKDKFSVCNWIKKNTDAPSDSVIWELDKNGGSTLFQRGSNKKFSINSVVGSEFELDTNWNHIAVTYNYTNKTYSLYLNGVAYITNGTGLDFHWISTPASSTFGASRIGRPLTVALQSFHGYIGDFRIYNGILSGEQVLSIYQGNSI